MSHSENSETLENTQQELVEQKPQRTPEEICRKNNQLLVLFLAMCACALVFAWWI